MVGNTFFSLGMCIFHLFLSFVPIQDLAFKGPILMWNNKKLEGEYIFLKLDKALVNDGWLARYLCNKALFLPLGISDHSPIVVSLFEWI